jgi:serine protease Do
MGLRLATPSEQQLTRFGLADNAQGALVTNVQPNSTAAKSGLRPGDLITRVGDKNVATADDAAEALDKLDLTKGVALNVTNKDGQRFVFVKSGK